ncbi:MAG: PQQ-binding-like beta-propeller repeat protein [Euryarchaeota archaeon]
MYDDGGTRPNNKLKWNFVAGGGVNSSPAVANGVVYVGSACIPRGRLVCRQRSRKRKEIKKIRHKL